MQPLSVSPRPRLVEPAQALGSAVSAFNAVTPPVAVSSPRPTDAVAPAAADGGGGSGEKFVPVPRPLPAPNAPLGVGEESFYCASPELTRSIPGFPDAAAPSPSPAPTPSPTRAAAAAPAFATDAQAMLEAQLLDSVLEGEFADAAEFEARTTADGRGGKGRASGKAGSPGDSEGESGEDESAILAALEAQLLVRNRCTCALRAAECMALALVEGCYVPTLSPPCRTVTVSDRWNHRPWRVPLQGILPEGDSGSD
jgi:hypothetical protein